MFDGCWVIFQWLWSKQCNISYKAMQEELEAEENLRKFSQNTHYLFEWNDQRQNQPQLQHKHKENLNHSRLVPQPSSEAMRKRALKREESEKYDLKKWESRQEMINKIEYPLNGEGLFSIEEQYVLPKCRVNDGPPAFKRRDEVNKHILKSIEAEYVKAKLEQFKRKNEQSQRELRLKVVASSHKSLPRTLQIKRKNHSPNLACEPSLSNDLQIMELRRIVTNCQRKYSLPHLPHIN